MPAEPEKAKRIYMGSWPRVFGAGLLVFLLSGQALHAEETWRGLTIAAEFRCASYDPGDYPYPQSVEDRIITNLGGVYSPYTGEWFADKYETDIERCWFAHRVIEVRKAYSLTIDRREARALDAVLASCDSLEVVFYPRGATEAALGSADEEPCGPYKNCTELRKDHPAGVPKGHCAYQSRMDRDKDGWACE